jgi:uncharacterized protein YbjQ (UPF0145 family)
MRCLREPQCLGMETLRSSVAYEHGHSIDCGEMAIALLWQGNLEAMQVSYANKLEGGRRYHSIGRIKASSRWRGANDLVPEADRLAAVRALIREAEDYEADAIVGLDFELDSVDGVEIGGVPLRRVAATGLAVKFDEAA